MLGGGRCGAMWGPKPIGLAWVAPKPNYYPGMTCGPKPSSGGIVVAVGNLHLLWARMQGQETAERCENYV